MWAHTHWYSIYISFIFSPSLSRPLHVYDSSFRKLPFVRITVSLTFVSLFTRSPNVYHFIHLSLVACLPLSSPPSPPRVPPFRHHCHCYCRRCPHRTSPPCSNPTPYSSLSLSLSICTCKYVHVRVDEKNLFAWMFACSMRFLCMYMFFLLFTCRLPNKFLRNYFFLFLNFCLVFSPECRS